MTDRIKRFLIQHTNDSDINELCYKSWDNNSGIFIRNTEHSTVYVESAVIDLSSMVLAYDVNYKFCVSKFDKTPLPLLPNTNNFFSFKDIIGPNLNSITELNQFFYYVFSKTGVSDNVANSKNFGDISFDNDNIATLTISDTVYTNTYQSKNYAIWANNDVVSLFPDFFIINNPQILNGDTEPYYQLKTGAPVINKYEYPTGYKAVDLSRIMITSPQLPISPSYINKGDYFIVEKVLNSFLVNTVTLDINAKTSLVYAPYQLQIFSLSEGNLPIDGFDISIKLVYKNNRIITHTLLPGDSYSIVIVFREGH